VRIPKGVATGQKLKLRGKGNDARAAGESGDLFVIINVSEHPLFQRRGSDLHCVVPIRFSSAALGANIAVPTLTKESTIKVPPGTESGRVLRLSGRGLPTMKGGRTGDLHFELQVETPSSLNPAQRKAVETLDKVLDNSAHPRHAAFAKSMKERS
jgi:molecular chaperone DnaJ